MIIREELQTLVEGPNKFDAEKVLQLIPKDKFLSYTWKKMKNKYKGSKEKKGLEYLFDTYVDGDRTLERLYKKIK
jgi:hypothetical protein